MPEEIVFLSFTSIVAVTALGFGLMRTISRHLERKYKGPGDGNVQAELDDLSAHQQEQFDELRGRMAELEERVDFTERLLTRGDAERQAEHS